MCAFGRQVRSDVTMEEVCCRFAKCRRRTSSLTLTLPRPKLVRLEILKIVWVAPDIGPPAHKIEVKQL